MSSPGSSNTPNPFWAFLTGLGRFVNFANTLLFNIIMLMVLLLLFALIGLAKQARDGQPGFGAVHDKTALVIDLEGALVEQYTSSPFKRAFAEASGDDAGREMQLRDLTRALRMAKGDDKIQRVLLLTDGFSVAGFAALRELGAALRDFRAGGKQVIAYGAGMEQKGYYLAAQADEAYLDPDGGVLLEGLGRYRL